MGFGLDNLHFTIIAKINRNVYVRLSHHAYFSLEVLLSLYLYDTIRDVGGIWHEVKDIKLVASWVMCVLPHLHQICELVYILILLISLDFLGLVVDVDFVFFI